MRHTTTQRPAASSSQKVNITKRSPTTQDSGPRTQDLSPEQRVVLAALRIDHAQDDVIRELPRGPLDWEALEKYALRHGVLPLVYTRLAELAAGDRADRTDGTEAVQHRIPVLPDSLRALYLSNARRNMVLAERLIGLLEMFERAGIQAVPIKGPVLAVQAYGDLSMRQMTDLDVLIRPRDFRAAYDLLVSDGFTPADPVPPGRERWLFRTTKEIVFHGRGCQLDLQWAFSEPYERGLLSRLDPQDTWTRLRLVSLGDRDVFALSPEDTLLQLAVHGAIHNWDQARWVADIAHLIASHPEMDWARVDALSGNAGARDLLSDALLLARDLVGSPFLALGGSAGASPSICHQVSNVLDGWTASESEGSRFLPTFIRRHWRRPSRGAALYLLGLLFLPKLAEWRLVRLPEPLYPLYYVIRPARLLVGLIWESARWLFRR